jgi:hypothetical protein
VVVVRPARLLVEEAGSTNDTAGGVPAAASTRNLVNGWEMLAYLPYQSAVKGMSLK